MYLEISDDGSDSENNSGQIMVMIQINQMLKKRVQLKKFCIWK